MLHLYHQNGPRTGEQKADTAQTRAHLEERRPGPTEACPTSIVTFLPVLPPKGPPAIYQSSRTWG